jgi:MYXO-CTERM domain-containing protein
MLAAVRLLLALVLVVLCARPGEARACSCMAQSIEDAIAGSDAIFEGIVDSIEEGDGVRHVRFSVTQSWEGVETERVEVTTSASSASCGYPFEVGTAYLVYATEDAGLEVSLCSRTRPMDEADEDRRELGSGVVPVEITDEPIEPVRPPRTAPGRAGCASCAVGRGERPALGLVVVALALASRRSRNRT